MTYKNYPVPARQDLLHNLDLTFTNKESRLPERNFFYVIGLSWKRGAKYMFPCNNKAGKRSPSRSTLEKSNFYWKKKGCKVSKNMAAK